MTLTPKEPHPCYIHAGAATFVQVARPKPSPLTLTAAAPAPAVTGPPTEEVDACDETATGPAPWPGPASLDDFFGPGAAQ